MIKSLISLIPLLASAQATVLWSGLFNCTTTVADFDKWSWSNQIQPYQWYIHGSGPTTEYLALSSSYKNPADTSDAQGIKITIDGTAFWNGQTMERSEIIPQTSTNIGTGHLYYHFSLSTSTTNPPNPGFEHQIAFFESHFTEIKYGLISGEAGTTDNLLRWDVGGVTKWSTPLVAGTWYNFAYDIDFSAGTIGLWQSTGGAALTNVVSGVSGSPSTNSADWHVGELRLPNGGTNAAAEDWYWSGIFVESGSITTSIAGPYPGQGNCGGTVTTASPTTTTTTTTTTTSPKTSTTTTKSTTTTTTKSTTTTASPTTKSTTTTTTTTTTTAGGATQTHWGQCGGIGYTGPTVCAAGTTCQVGNPYYSQCL